VVIFIFPIVFQAIHIVWHHTHGYAKPHNVCHSFAPVKTAQSGASIEIQHDELCALCEYKISVNEVPKANAYRSIEPVSHQLSERLEIQLRFFPFYSAKSPRAPPASIA